MIRIVVNVGLFLSGLSLFFTIAIGKWHTYTVYATQGTFGGAVVGFLFSDWGIGGWKALVGCLLMMFLIIGITYVIDIFVGTDRVGNNVSLLLIMTMIITMCSGIISLFSSAALPVLYAHVVNFTFPVYDVCAVYFYCIVFGALILGCKAILKDHAGIVYAIIASAVILWCSLLLATLFVAWYWVLWLMALGVHVYMRISGREFSENL